MREFVERNIDSIAQVLESAMVEKTDSAFSCIYQCILSPEDDREK